MLLNRRGPCCSTVVKRRCWRVVGSGGSRSATGTPAISRHVMRIDLETDARNARSRAAIERVGARFAGVLRNRSKSWAPGEDGLLRDSAMFAITAAAEWPDCRDRLVRQLEAGGKSGGQPGTSPVGWARESR
ncbi:MULTISPECIES: GNAT family N-acetyltransferase [unclassified Actinoplanes]|uniref:GNAT family N-acetyltransferase n=1 Tax=unclassified Actinoplanes TaxID=2626549 RepID=UPI0018D3FE3B|nr:MULTISPECIES: GNAT family protein [unclassified Actinoplanes]